MANRTDTFNRTNGAAIGTPSDAGSAWIQQSGTWIISGSAGVGGTGAANESSGASQCTCVLESSMADCDVQLTSMGSGSGQGICFRSTDDSNYLLLDLGTSTVQVYSRIAGSFATVGSSASVTAGDQDIWKVTLSGNNITVFQNGTLRITTSSTFNNTATLHGLRTTSNNGLFYDNFSAVGAAAAFIAPLAFVHGQAVRRSNYY